MVYAHLAPFDIERDFVTLTFFRAFGIAFERGVPFPGKEENGEPRAKEAPLLKLLYENRKIGFAEATVDEEAAAFAPASIEEKGGGWYHVSVPWEDEPHKVRSKDSATLLAHQLRDAGEPLDHHGVAIVEGENAYYRVNAAWLAEPETIHGWDAAYERATALRKDGPPAGWVDPSLLIGSDNFQATYEIGGETVQLGELVRAALAASGHDGVVWNALDTETRDGFIRAELERREADAAPDETEVDLEAGLFLTLRGGETHSETEATDEQLVAEWTSQHEAGDEMTVRINVADGSIESLSDGEWGKARDATEAELAYERSRAPRQLSKEDRIAALVDGNSEKQLRDRIAAIDEARAAADPPLDPLGAKSDHNKADLAKLIVDVDGDLEPAEAGEDGDGGAA